ncbi:dehydration-responsive element-binding protein 1E-like [Wolffia australiana]
MDSAKSDGGAAAAPPKRAAGRTKLNVTRHPVYRGVRQRGSAKWVCEVREPNKRSRIWLGTFPTPEMAARAHDVAAMALRGDAACLNFADSAWRLPALASSASPGEIRRVAALAVEAFRPADDVIDHVAVAPPAAPPAATEDDGFWFSDFGVVEDDGPHLDDVDAQSDVYLWSFSVQTRSGPST